MTLIWDSNGQMNMNLLNIENDPFLTTLQKNSMANHIGLNLDNSLISSATNNNFKEIGIEKIVDDYLVQDLSHESKVDEDQHKDKTQQVNENIVKESHQPDEKHDNENANKDSNNEEETHKSDDYGEQYEAKEHEEHDDQVSEQHHSENTLEIIKESVDCFNKDAEYKVKITLTPENDNSSSYDISLKKENIKDKIRCAAENNDLKIVLDNNSGMFLIFETDDDTLELKEFAYNSSQKVITNILNLIKPLDSPYLHCSPDSNTTLNMHDKTKFNTNLKSITIECEYMGKKALQHHSEDKKIAVNAKNTTKSIISENLPTVAAHKSLSTSVDCSKNNLKIKIMMSFMLNDGSLLEQSDLNNDEKVRCTEVDDISIIRFDNSLGLSLDIANDNHSILLKQVNFRNLKSEHEILNGVHLKMKISSSNNILSCSDKSSFTLDLYDKIVNYNDVQSIKFECKIDSIGSNIQQELHSSTLKISNTTSSQKTTAIEGVQSASTKTSDHSSGHKPKHMASNNPIQIKMNQFFPIVLAVCLLILIVFSVVGYFFNRSLNNMNYRRFQI